MSFIRTCSEISEDSSAQISHRGVPLMQTTSGPSLNCHFSPHSAPTCNPHSVLSSPQQPPQISAQTPSSSRWAPWSSRSRCWNSWTPATTGGRRGSSGVTWPASGAPTGRRSLRSTTKGSFSGLTVRILVVYLYRFSIDRLYTFREDQQMLVLFRYYVDKQLRKRI